jgi:flagellar L-ring protein precursor FlgH
MIKQKTKSLCLNICIVLSVFCLFFLSACATAPQLPPHPPKYVYQEVAIPEPSTNSLWRDSAGLFEDIKARRVNDLVTIKVIENIVGSNSADTSTSRDSSADFSMTDFFGMNNDFNLHNLWGLKGFYKGSNVFSPTVKGKGKSDFKGDGNTAREGKLIGTITAKIVELMPNGNLVLESRKDITINREKQVLIFRGMIRPDDIASDNTILSSRVADAEIYLVGDGVVQDKQGPGWLVRILDKAWPF